MPPPMPSDGGTAWGHGGARADDGGPFEFGRARSTSNHHHQHGATATVGQFGARFRDARLPKCATQPISDFQNELNWHRVSRNQCVEGERASSEEQKEEGGEGNHVSSIAAAAASMDRLCYKCGSACSREQCPSCGTIFEQEPSSMTSDG